MAPGEDARPQGVAGGGATPEPPAPRLQFRWERLTEIDDPVIGSDWLCHYEFVLPLGDFDIRREIWRDGQQVGMRSELAIPIKGPTKCNMTTVPCYWHGSPEPFADTPFRDGAHATWDAPHFGNPPVWVLTHDGRAVAKTKCGVNAPSEGSPERPPLPLVKAACPPNHPLIPLTGSIEGPMAERRYTYATTLNWGGDTPTAEIEVEVSYTVAWGSLETGRYGPPEHYDPGCVDMVEDIRLEKVEGKPRPWGMGYGYIPDDDFATDCVEKIEGSDSHLEAMLTEASEREAAADDEARERQYEARREMAREPDHTGEPW